mgnify:CR=1 FL=1
MKQLERIHASVHRTVETDGEHYITIAFEGRTPIEMPLESWSVMLHHLQHWTASKAEETYFSLNDDDRVSDA